MLSPQLIPYIAAILHASNMAGQTVKNACILLQLLCLALTGVIPVVNAYGFTDTPEERKERLDHYFNFLSRLPVDFTDPSAVEEELARAELAKFYPPEEYVIARGIEYWTDSAAVAGELDLVIMSKETGRIVLIAELKKRPGEAARKKMESQHKRFRSHFSAGTITSMASRSNLEPHIPQEAFDNNWHSILIGLRHTKSVAQRLPLHLADVYPSPHYKVIPDASYITSQPGYSDRLAIIREVETGKVVGIGKQIDRKKKIEQSTLWTSTSKRLRRLFMHRRGIYLFDQDKNEIPLSLISDDLDVFSWVPRERILLERDMSQIHDWTLDLFRGEVAQLQNRLTSFQRKILSEEQVNNKSERLELIAQKLNQIRDKASAGIDFCMNTFFLRTSAQ